MEQSQSTSKIKKNKYHIMAILFWITIWQMGSMIVDKEMLLPSPFAVMNALVVLVREGIFWKSICNSFLKIAMGFVLAILFGMLLASISYVNYFLKEMLSPLMRMAKATPVASFIILALLWVDSSNLSILISFLMVIPVIYTNVLQGLYSADGKLLEMAKVFRLSPMKKIRYLYLPAVMPYFVSACSLGLGFCWKSGIAAEIIGLPKNSIGEQLYQAKIYLMTKELFAWTFVIIVISVIFEKLIMWALNKVQNLANETSK
jgi:NitT/TauT family transport system permease protein